jgi:hypothetical protein
MRRKRLALIAAAVALMAVPGAVSAVDPTQPAYGGPLSGAQENPPVATSATGQGTVVISADGSTITYLVTHSGLSGTVNAAHIHTGAVGANGGVILPLAAGASPMTGTLTSANFSSSGSITTFAQAVAAIRAGTTYFNLHTTANPGGEVRGQIGVTVAAPAPTPAPTTAPTTAPTAEPEPAEPTLPPTTVGAPVTSGDGGATGIVTLAGLLAAAGTLAWIGRRRSSRQG